MSEIEVQRDLFHRWFKQPLADLYNNTDAGFAVLMITLPGPKHLTRSDLRLGSNAFVPIRTTEYLAPRASAATFSAQI